MEIVRLAFNSIGATTLTYIATILVTAFTLGLLIYVFKHVFSN